MNLMEADVQDNQSVAISHSQLEMCSPARNVPIEPLLPMALNELVLAGQAFSVPCIPLFMNCQTFMKDPVLLATAYQIRSPVAVNVFRTFLSVVEGTTPKLLPDFDRMINCFNFSGCDRNC
jgi:hypothetical protein